MTGETQGGTYGVLFRPHIRTDDSVAYKLRTHVMHGIIMGCP